MMMKIPMTVFGGLQSRRIIMFNFFNSVVSIPMTVLGGLQCNDALMNQGFVLPFQYR